MSSCLLKEIHLTSQLQIQQAYKSGHSAQNHKKASEYPSLIKSAEETRVKETPPYNLELS